MELTQKWMGWDELKNEIENMRKTREEAQKEAPFIVNGEKVYRCAKCKDTGWYDEHEKVLADSSGKPYAYYRFATQCDCTKLHVAKKKLEQSGIDENMRFANYETRNIPILEQAKDAAMKYADSFELFENERTNSIIFCGQPGAGKTHLGTSICRQLIDKLGVQVIYMPYRNAVTELKQCIKDETEYGKLIKRYATARALYIDDMCKGKTTESDINIMYEIINYRYLHRLPLIISTEKLIDELDEWDDAIGSRIYEMCRGNVIQFEGKELNYRLR